VAVACLAFGCGRTKTVVVHDERGGLSEPPVALVGRKSPLPPIEGRDPPVEPVAVPRARAAEPPREKMKAAPPPPREPESPAGAPGGEALGRAASPRRRPGPAGPRPDRHDVQGDPEVRQPDELTPLPTDRPQRYASPAPLKKVLTPLRIGDQALGDAAAVDADSEIDVSAAPAAFPPQRTAALDDAVPDSVVVDPEELGSYHVQVSSSPSFGGILFDKEYPFMADIDLRQDLLNMEVRHGRYWIRYAVVDLLGFHHPYSRPRRILLNNPQTR
jgi:hypothetical protein